MKNSSKTTSLFTTILASAVTGGILGALITNRLQHNKLSKIISNADSLANELKAKIEQQKKALLNKTKLKEDALRDKELMETIVTNIKQKMQDEGA